MTDLPCTACGNPVPLSRHDCPHCGEVGDTPNVKAAKLEEQALHHRYLEALRNADIRGCRTTVDLFDEAASRSHAVIAKDLREIDRCASSDRQLMTTYYQLISGQARVPDGDEWDTLRRLADESAFPGYKEHVQFAALSLDDAGVPGYGPVSIVLREDLIAQRASVYEENSALFMKQHAYAPPRGHRATWIQRARLCVAKIAPRIDTSTLPERFPSLLLQRGTTATEHQFVEVHIFGSMSIRTVKKVIVRSIRSRAMLKSLRDRLLKVGIAMEVAQ
jgi:hypothetical protein